MLKPLPREAASNCEISLQSSKKALQYMHGEAVEQKEEEITEVLSEAIFTCETLITETFEDLSAPTVAHIKFHFIRAVLVLSSEEMAPLLAFLKWLTTRKEYH